MKIEDEFSALPISRQRKFQLRMRRDGRCASCGAPAAGSLCAKHLAAARERSRVRQGSVRRYKSASYRMAQPAPTPGAPL